MADSSKPETDPTETETPKPEAPKTPKASSPKPEASKASRPETEPAPPKPTTQERLASAIEALASETGLAGHELLGKVSTLDDKEPFAVAAGRIAFALNTGLVPAAVFPLSEMSHADLAALLVAHANKSQASVTAALRSRWPDPKRPLS